MSQSGIPSSSFTTTSSGRSSSCSFYRCLLLTINLIHFVHGSKSQPLLTVDADAAMLEQRATNPQLLRSALESSAAVGDRDALIGQDGACDEFVYSSLVQPHPNPQAFDLGSNGLFGMPSSMNRRSTEYQFQTPNYPNPYPDNMECIKIISAPSKDQRILLNFRGSFEFEPQPRCGMDFLEIRDGAFGFSPLFGRFCGRGLPNIGTGLKSTGPYMWLRFRSDATIPHKGFQAVYRFFQASSFHPVDNVYRFRHRMDLDDGEMRDVDEKYLLDQLQDFPVESREMPIEAVFDVRAPSDSWLNLHVVNVTVPRDFSWSCSPGDLQQENTAPRCRVGHAAMPRLDFDEPDTRMDPSSIIDGRQTVFEVYPRNTTSAYSPPCPKIRRFCDRSVGIPSQLEKKAEFDRDFMIRWPRVVIRLIIASPLRAPRTKSVRHATDSGDEGAIEEAPRRNRTRRHDPMAQTLPQMPTFHFQITVLRKAKRNTQTPCDELWTPCDAETCIRKSLWCDKIHNCPHREDEGSHCDYMSEKNHIVQDLRERKIRENEAEHLAAQKLHLSILATLGIGLVLITTSCILMTIRRRRRENQRRMLKLIPGQDASPSRRSPGLNHVHSTGALLDDNRTRRSHGRKRRGKNVTPTKPKALDHSPDGYGWPQAKLTGGQSNVIWPSEESVRAPLLWSPQSTSGATAGLARSKLANQTAPSELVFADRVDWTVDPSATESPSRGHIRTSAELSKPSHSGQPGSSGCFTPPSTAHLTHPVALMDSLPPSRRSPQTGKDQAIHSSGPVFTVEPIKSPARTNGAKWVIGSSSPVKNPRHQQAIAPYPPNRPKTVVDMSQLAGHHVPSCRLITRTQSWGGGLRLAGVTSWHKGEWEVTHSVDRDDPPPLGRPEPAWSHQKLTPLGQSVQVYPVLRESTGQAQEDAMVRHKSAYTSMPNMPENVEPSHAGRPHHHEPPRARSGFPRAKMSTRDYKPPSAKRPRIVSQSVGTWVPTSCTDDDDDGGSTETPMLDDHGSVLSEARMPEIQADPMLACHLIGKRDHVQRITEQAYEMTTKAPTYYGCRTEGRLRVEVDQSGGGVNTDRSGTSSTSNNTTTATRSASDTTQLESASPNEVSLESDLEPPSDMSATQQPSGTYRPNHLAHHLVGFSPGPQLSLTEQQQQQHPSTVRRYGRFGAAPECYQEQSGRCIYEYEA